MIVCGTDLSERSLPAEEAAAALAARLGERELWLTYVLEAPGKFEVSDAETMLKQLG